MAVTVRSRKSKRKGTVLYLDVVHKGHRKRMSLGTTNIHEARRIAARMEQTLRLKGWIDDPAGQISLKDFVRKYMAYRHATKAKSTCRLDEHALRELLKFMGDVPMTAITQQDVEEFKVHRLTSVTAASANAELRHLKAAFSYAVSQEMLKTNPAQRVRLCKVAKNTHQKFLDREQIQRLQIACDSDPELRRMVDFALHTGLRRAEITSLEWQDVDFTRKIILVQNKDTFRTKSGKDRQILMSNRVEELLRSSPDKHSPGRVFKHDYWIFGKRFRAAVIRSGLPAKTSIHTLRHTFASHLVMQGVDLRSIKELLGHSDISVTMIYSHLSPEHLSGVIEKIPY